MENKLNKSKVIIIVGFLGAGKTTLIESIIKSPVLSKRIAVIQNEFSSDMGLETPLMKDSDGNDIQDFYEMPNGCICCASKNDLINTLDSLLEKKKNIDYILVETNGLSEPSALIKTFWLDDGLFSKVEYHQTIGLIDSKNFSSQLKNKVEILTQEKEPSTEEQLLKNQIIFAEKILLNKIDLLGENKEETIDFIKHCINEVNPHADIIETIYSKMPLEFLIEKNEEKQKAIQPTSYKCCYNTDKNEHNHKAIQEIQSIYLNIEDILLDKNQFERFMGEILWERPKDIHIMRCKGLFNFIDDDSLLGQYMLQGVEDIFEFRMTEITQWKSAKFLFVGKNIDKEELIKGIQGCKFDTK